MTKQGVGFSVIFLISMLFGISSCYVDTAETPHNQVVTIYTDCLLPSDTTLFHSFSQKNQVRVRIVSNTADSILSELKVKGINTSADILLFHSLYDTKRAQRLGIFHRIPKIVVNDPLDPKYTSVYNTWFGIGKNPYVFVFKHDTLEKLNNYQNIADSSFSINWSTNISRYTDAVPFFAPFLRKMDRSKAIAFFSHYQKTGIKKPFNFTEKKPDSLETRYYLSYFSEYRKLLKEPSNPFKHASYVFPNQRSNGVHYNMICAGVVSQARNFENAKLLIEYMLSTEVNERLNNHWNTFPIRKPKAPIQYPYQNNAYNEFRTPSKFIVEYFSDTQRILAKLKETETQKTDFKIPVINYSPKTDTRFIPEMKPFPLKGLKEQKDPLKQNAENSDKIDKTFIRSKMPTDGIPLKKDTKVKKSKNNFWDRFKKSDTTSTKK
jgi:ABC-type Fe3+ transport system substrate-binding protein